MTPVTVNVRLPIVLTVGVRTETEHQHAEISRAARSPSRRCRGHRRDRHDRPHRGHRRTGGDDGPDGDLPGPLQGLPARRTPRPWSRLPAAPSWPTTRRSASSSRSSGNTAFDDRIRANNKVEGVSATADYATQLDDVRGRRRPSGRSPATCRTRRPPTRDDVRRAAVGHAPDAHPGGARDHRRQPGGRRGHHRHRRRLPAPRPPGEHLRRRQRQLPERCAGPGRGGGRRRQRARHAHGGHDRRGRRTASGSSASPRT